MPHTENLALILQSAVAGERVTDREAIVFMIVLLCGREFARGRIGIRDDRTANDVGGA